MQHEARTVGIKINTYKTEVVPIGFEPIENLSVMLTPALT